MPNWCSNTLTITGPKEQVDILLERMKNPDWEPGKKNIEQWVICDTLCPMPAELEGLGKLYSNGKGIGCRNGSSDPITDEQSKEYYERFGCDNAYDWAIENWGSKWGDCYARLEQDIVMGDLREIVFRFDSAWSPPVDAICTGSEKWPKLLFTIEYEEEGIGFKGSSSYANGIQTENEVNNDWELDPNED